MLFFDFAQAADAAADQHAAAMWIPIGKVDAGVLDRVMGGGESKLGEPVEALDVFRIDVEMIRKREIRELAPNLHLEIGYVKPLQPTDAALSGADPLPKLVDIAR
jgi:hypothetical protein